MTVSQSGLEQKKAAPKFLVDPDFKLTTRRRNNMHGIISSYNLLRKLKLKKSMAKYLKG
jgi:hypothetical protein